MARAQTRPNARVRRTVQSVFQDPTLHQLAHKSRHEITDTSGAQRSSVRTVTIHKLANAVGKADREERAWASLPGQVAVKGTRKTNAPAAPANERISAGQRKAWRDQRADATEQRSSPETNVCARARCRAERLEPVETIQAQVTIIG